MSNKKSVVVILLVAIIFAAGNYFLLQYLDQPSEIPDGWIESTDPNLRIKFRHPADAMISEIGSRVIGDATIDELIVIPAGVDATRVHFFTTDAPLENAQNIKIYESLELEKSEFESAEIDGIAGVRRVDYLLRNDCTNEFTVVPRDDAVFGINLVQCPTHPEGYDATRRAIADSVEFISEK
jgi:hypothetical protein